MVKEGLKRVSGICPEKKNKQNNFAAIPADFNPLIIVLQLQEAGPATFKKPLIISWRSCKTILLLFPDFCLNNVFNHRAPASRGASGSASLQSHLDKNAPRNTAFC